MNVVIFRGNSPSFLRADEPAVHHAACEPGAAGLHPADRPGEGILPQRNAEIRNNLCRRIEVIEEPHHTRTEHVTGAHARRGLVSGKPEEMIALVMREAQRPRDRVDRLLGRAGAAALLESRVEVGGDVCEGGDLFPPQPRGPATAAQRESDVVRLEGMAVTAQKVRDRDSVHVGVCDVPQTLSRDTQSLDERTLVTVAPRGVHTDASFRTGAIVVTRSEEAGRTARLLALMTKGDDMFNARDFAALDAVHHPDMIAYIPGNAQPIYGRAAHAVAMRQLVQIFADIHVHTPYPTQCGSGDWITVVTRATGTFRGEMVLPNGKGVAPTGKAFEVEFGQTTKWDADRLIIISAFLDTALQAKQLGLAE